MDKIPTYERRVSPQSPPMPDANTGSEQFMAALRGNFSKLAGQVGGMADRAAVNEGERAGLVAGIDPEFRPARRDTLYGNAFDRAGTRTWLDSRENELTARIDALSIQFEADPQGLATAIGDLEQQTVAELAKNKFPEAQAAFAGFFSRARTSYVRGAMRENHERQKQIYLATTNETVTARMNAIGRAAYTSGLDEEADKTIAAEIEALRRTVEAQIEAGVYTAEQGRRIIETATKEGVTGRIGGVFDRLPTADAKRKFLDDFRKGYSEGGELTSVLSLGDAESLISSMETGIRQAEAQHNARLSAIGSQARSIEDRAQEGFSPPPAEIEQLRSEAEATGDPAAIARADAAAGMVQLSENLTRMTPLEIEVLRRQTVLDMENNGASPRAIEVLGAIDGVKGKMQGALNTDAYAWGARAGQIDPQPAINWNDPDLLAATLKQRLSAREIMRARYGGVPFFTTAEKDALTFIARNGGEQALTVARGLVTALGPASTDALKEVADDAPVLTNLAGLLANRGSSAIAEDALAAISERKLKETKPVTISEAQEQLTARGFFGGAYLADARAEGAVRNTARLAFEKRARDLGLDGDLSNSSEARSLYELTLDEAAGANWRGGVKHGGIDDVNGVKVIVPPDAREGEVEALLHRLDPGRMDTLPQRATVNGVPVSARQLQGARLIGVGNGRWRVALGDPRSTDPRYVMTPDGDFWTIGIDHLRRAAREQTMQEIMPNSYGVP